MPFRSGSIAYARFRVVSTGSITPPADASQDILDALARHALKPGDIGEPSPVEFGWCGGRHVFDEEFAPDHNVFGRSLLFALRIDTNKVPADIRRAYRAMSETMFLADTPTGFLSRRERAAAREDAEERCRQELASGKYRRSKMVEILWDLKRGVLLAPVFAEANVAGLRDLFFSTFDLRLEPATAGSLAFDILSTQGRSRDYEDLLPSRFTSPPAGYSDGDRAESTGASSESSRPQVPWSHSASEASDFLGNEFLLWLWRAGDAEGGELDLAGKRGPNSVACILDRSLDMECAWDVTGKLSLHNGVMTRAPEALRALQIGKWPRKAGLAIASAGEGWQAALLADRWQFSGLRLEPPKENPRLIRELIEHRLDSLSRFDSVMLALFESFLDARAGGGWTAERRRMSDWIGGRKAAPHRAPLLEPKLERAEEFAESASEDACA